jgi:hypothetical protein
MTLDRGHNTFPASSAATLLAPLPVRYRKEQLGENRSLEDQREPHHPFEDLGVGFELNNIGFELAEPGVDPINSIVLSFAENFCRFNRLILCDAARPESFENLGMYRAYDWRF